MEELCHKLKKKTQIITKKKSALIRLLLRIFVISTVFLLFITHIIDLSS